MSGETSLEMLIADMSADLAEEVFVFATFPLGEVPRDVQAQMQFEEAEGATLILRRKDALARGIEGEFPCRKITLTVHSSLEAVGFMARITEALAAEGLGVNPVSGFFHDHLFVPEDRAEDAMRVLLRMSADAR